MKTYDTGYVSYGSYRLLYKNDMTPTTYPFCIEILQYDRHIILYLRVSLFGTYSTITY